MDDCLWTDKPKPSRYIISAKVKSAFQISGVCRSSTGLSGCSVKEGHVHLYLMAGSTWQVMLHSSKMGFPWEAMVFR